MKMKEKKMGPGQIIFAENEVVDKIYILMSGDVEILVKLNSKKMVEIEQVSAGGLLGEFPFFTEKLSNLTAISKNVASLVYLDKSDFLITIKDFPD